MLTAALATLIAASPPLTEQDAFQLQRVRTDVAQWVNITCGEGQCVYRDTRLRIWRFAGRDVLVRAIRDDDQLDPEGHTWTDLKLASAFPEFEPRTIALNAMRGPASGIWSALLKWVAEDPRRVDAYGPQLWQAFVAERKGDPYLAPWLAKRSPFGTPYGFDELAYLGMTPDELRVGATILRCEKALQRAIDHQMQGGEISPELFRRWLDTNAASREELVDAWGTPLQLANVGQGGGEAKLGTHGPYFKGMWLEGWHITSAGPDREPRTKDDVNCGDILRLDGPPKISRYGPPPPRGKYDDQIDAALIARMREGNPPHGPPISDPVPLPEPEQ